MSVTAQPYAKGLGLLKLKPLTKMEESLHFS